MSVIKITPEKDIILVPVMRRVDTSDTTTDTSNTTISTISTITIMAIGAATMIAAVFIFSMIRKNTEE